ncbi:MAG: glycosyltransferase [Micropepsaceae bacterium]
MGHIEYTVVITSCRRFDLLRKTIQTLVPNLDVPARKWIVVEDSDQQAVYDSVKGLGVDIDVIVNETQLGQMRSIDRAYDLVTTPYIFHCEDDWEFFRKGFIGESLAILDQFPKVSMVGLRARSELNPLVREMPRQNLNGVEYFMLDPKLHPEYFSYSFNPGLRRLSDFKAYGPFGAIGPEHDVSYTFKKAGFNIANLEHPAVQHIGDGRHVHDPTQHKKAKGLFAKLARSARKRWKRLVRSVSE